jgi:cellulose biosynthesis protein BcsQ
MKPTPVPPRQLPADKPALQVPLVPSLVVGSFKGGVWKTSLAVAIAERLAWAGLHVLFLVADKQEDARSRLGLRGSTLPYPRVARGEGSITVVGAKGSKATELLYRSGFARLGLDKPDVVVVDTPPVEEGGSLPGVLLVATTDGDDASRNLVSMLRQTPANTHIVLVRIKRTDPEEWENDAAVIAQASKHKDLLMLKAPLPASKPIEKTLGQGRSVWELPRRGCTLEFLNGVETLAGLAWDKLFPDRPMPSKPPPSKAAAEAYIPGWDDDDDA